MRLLVVVFLFLVHSAVFAAHLSFDVPQPGGYYLASYYGDGVLLVDSLVAGRAQSLIFLDEDLPEGVYFLSNGRGGRFDFLLGEDQEFYVDVNFIDINQSCIEGALESERFLYYQKRQADLSDTNQRSELIDSCLEGMSEQSLLALILNAIRPLPEVSSVLSLPNEMVVYDAKVAHYWDNYNLEDARIVRTPFFAKRVDNYLRRVLLPREDKIRQGVLPLFQRAEANDEVLKILASKSLSLAIENEIMGIDALGYEVISRYYLSGRFGELSQKQLAMLLEYVRNTVNCRVGHLGKEIVLRNWEEEPEEVSLYHLQAEYTLLLFWEPDCAYCKAVMAPLRDEILPKYEALGLKVFAVNIQHDAELWRAYISENHLENWVHGIQESGESEFMEDYGVQGTPYIYILDREKRIVAKNVKVNFIDSMLSRLFAVGSIY